MTRERQQQTTRPNESTDGSSQGDADQPTELLGSLAQGLVNLSRQSMSWGARKAQGIQRVIEREED
jgi:hypothetical protein